MNNKKPKRNEHKFLPMMDGTEMVETTDDETNYDSETSDYQDNISDIEDSDYDIPNLSSDDEDNDNDNDITTDEGVFFNYCSEEDNIDMEDNDD